MSGMGYSYETIVVRCAELVLMFSQRLRRSTPE
jgi:hypothetical protein